MIPLHPQHHNPGANLTVVLLHGNSTCSALYHPVLRHWQHPSSVVLVDLPGHGQSPRHGIVADYRYPHLLDALEKTLRVIEGPILLTGHSFGGHLAMDLAPRLQKLTGLVITGAPPLRKPVNLAEAFKPVPNLDVFFSEQPEASDVASALHNLSAPSNHGPDLLSWFASTDPAVRGALALDLAENSLPDEVAHLRSVDLPKVMLCSDQDPLPNLDYVRSLDCGLTLREQPGNGHYMMLDEPAAFAATLAEIAG